MSITAAVAALLTGIIVWVLLARKLTAKPWQVPGPAESVTTYGVFGPPAAKVGLWVFLAVVTSLFALFLTAFWMRMGHGHGGVHEHAGMQVGPELPRLLWLNTAVLIAGSIGMQWAHSALARARVGQVKAGLLLGGALVVVFLIGQLLAWRQMSASGYFMAGNPAVAFFYLITAVHGLHLLGGLFVWGRTMLRLTVGRVDAIDLRLSIELCTVYWHFLLLVWLVLYAVLLST